MFALIGAEPLLRNTVSAERQGYGPRPHCCPATKSGSLGPEFGHRVLDLVIKGS